MARPAKLELPLQVMEFIAECPGTPPGEIAAAFPAESRSTVQRALNTLEARRWARQTPAGGWEPDIAAAKVWADFRRHQEGRIAEAEEALRETA